MTPETLRTIGQTLYGSAWQFSLADALGVSTRTINRWQKGERAIPDGILEEIRSCVVPERIRDLQQI